MLRVLLFSDTHLGLGEQHFSAYERALAFARDADLVVHAGDVFYRSSVKPGLVWRAFEPLQKLGVPVFVVPGNHERSAIPYPLLAMHPRVYIFDRPRTFNLNVNGLDVAICGFPCIRSGVREALPELEPRGDVRLLVLHPSVEGATVGPVNLMFRDGPDVIPRRAIPSHFHAVLAGHIHRHQVLSGHPPVFYAGATERTSSAELGEAKGCMTMDFDRSGLRGWRFHPW